MPAAMLVTKRSAGVALEVNIREGVTCMSLPSLNEAAHSAFESQRRCHQKSKNRGISGPKRTYVLQLFLKKGYNGEHTFVSGH